MESHFVCLKCRFIGTERHFVPFYDTSDKYSIAYVCPKCGSEKCIELRPWTEITVTENENPLLFGFRIVFNFPDRDEENFSIDIGKLRIYFKKSPISGYVIDSYQVIE